MEHVELEIAVYSNRLLEAHIQNVWKLGDEIRVLIIAGFSSVFELAINGNPSGVVDLVEAIKTYERAAERFEKKLNGHGNNVSAIDWLHSAVTSAGKPSGASDQSHKSVVLLIIIDPVVPSIILEDDGAFAKPAMFQTFK